MPLLNQQKPGAVAVAVLRGGGRIELEGDLSHMWQRQSGLGGTVVPAARPTQ